MSFSKKFNKARTAVEGTKKTASEISEKLKEASARKISVTLAEVKTEIVEFLINAAESAKIRQQNALASEKSISEPAETVLKCAIPVTIVFSPDELINTPNHCRAKYKIMEKVGVTIEITGDDNYLRNIYKSALKCKPSILGFENAKRNENDFFPPLYSAIFMDVNTWNNICEMENITVIHPEIESLNRTQTQSHPPLIKPEKSPNNDQYRIN